MTAINEATPELMAWRARWAKNRAFIAGEDAVKAAGQLYLPKVRSDDDDTLDYAPHKLRTYFYPSVHKIASGLLGLITRKPAELRTSERVTLLTRLLTSSGQSLDAWLEWAIREALTTDFGGALVDFPEATGTGINASNALARGQRPRVNSYSAENILELTPDFVDGDVALVRVRLLESAGKRVRELILNDQNVYEVIVHDEVDGGFEVTSRTTPRRFGQPLSRIPFTLLSTHDDWQPKPSMLQYCVDLNAHDYILEGERANLIHMTVGTVANVIGYTPVFGEDGKEKPFSLDVSPGAVNVIYDEKVKIETFKHEASNAEVLLQKIADIRNAQSTIGHSMIAPHRDAPESPTYTLLRSVAENATLSTFTNELNRKVTRVIQDFASWADEAAGEVDFQLNLDFSPTAITPQQHEQYRKDREARLITHQTYLEICRAGEVYPATMDVEGELERLQLESDDEPTADAEPLAPIA